MKTQAQQQRRAVTPQPRSALRRLAPMTATVLVALALGACSVSPKPLLDKEARDRAAADRLQMFDRQEPISGPVSLEEAIARALKYNLDLRLKKMEQAVYGQLHKVAKYDMLPNLVASAGYTERNNDSGGVSRRILPAFQRTTDPTTMMDRDRTMASAEFSWNVLDFGVSYFRAKQRADELLISEERRRRVAQTIVHDVRFAFWRALGAQRLANQAEALMQQAERAIEQSRTAEQRGAVPVQVALAYQRSLSDAVALLNVRRQELDMAKTELAALMSVPSASSFVLKDQPEQPLQEAPANVALLEDTALLSRPELREEDYRKRISGDETRRQLMQALPNLSFNLSGQYDSNSLYYNNSWIEGGLRASLSLMKLIAAPAVKKAGEKQLNADDARRQALSMAIVTQTRIAALRYGLAVSDLRIAQRSLEVDDRIAQVARAGVSAKAETELERVRAEARALVSRYQRAIAYASAQAAYARIQHTIGQDLELGPVEQQSVSELADRVQAALSEAEKALPTRVIAAAGPRPRVHVTLEEAEAVPGTPAMMKAVGEALSRSGFEVVGQSQPDALSLVVSVRVAESDKGLRRGEVVLRETPAEEGSKAGRTQYVAVLPEEPREGVMAAMGEAAVLSNVGHLREWIAARNAPRQ